MTSTDSALNQVEIPRPSRPHVDARTTGWLLEQRARIRELELANSRQAGELEVSARVERGAQKACDRLEEEVKRSRQREASMARALGYAEAERDQMQKLLAAPAPALEAAPKAAPKSRPRGLFGRRKRR